MLSLPSKEKCVCFVHLCMFTKKLRVHHTARLLDSTRAWTVSSLLYIACMVLVSTFAYAVFKYRIFGVIQKLRKQEEGVGGWLVKYLHK